MPSESFQTACMFYAGLRQDYASKSVARTPRATSAGMIDFVKTKRHRAHGTQMPSETFFRRHRFIFCIQSETAQQAYF